MARCVAVDLNKEVEYIFPQRLPTEPFFLVYYPCVCRQEVVAVPMTLSRYMARGIRDLDDPDEQNRNHALLNRPNRDHVYPEPRNNYVIGYCGSYRNRESDDNKDDSNEARDDGVEIIRDDGNEARDGGAENVRDDGNENVRDDGNENVRNDGNETVGNDGNENVIRNDGNETVRNDGNENVIRNDGNETIRNDGNETVRNDGNENVIRNNGNENVRNNGHENVRNNGHENVIRNDDDTNEEGDSRENPPQHRSENSPEPRRSIALDHWRSSSLQESYEDCSDSEPER